MSGKKRPIPAAGGLFDDFAEPFTLQQQSIPKAKRDPLRLFLVLEPFGAEWRQTDEVLAANLTTAGAVALEAIGKRSAVWSFPRMGAAVAKIGRQRVAVIDPELVKPADLPKP